MNKLVLLIAFVITALAQPAHAQKFEWKEAKSAGYTYKYVTNDPTNTRFYTLPNGLSVFLTPNKREPRVTMRLAIRTGSTNDPEDHTGLAHYLEHLLFKGTNKYGSLDWSKEKPLIDQIENLYEQYNSTTDNEKRKLIYRNIDSVSGIAAKYAIAGEYDVMMTALGSQGTNAHTWLDETIYKENVPSNAIDQLLKIQAERLRMPVFRLFHTELEAVYEEKNRGLDNDNSKMQEAMFELMFPGHKYGTQSTIGTIEHLKNPSITAIRKYYDKYYVPNNMALILAGDLNPDKLIKTIDQTFGYLKKSPVETYKGPELSPIKSVQVKEIYGPSAESVRIVYRSAAANTKDAMLASLTRSILSNGVAGLIDLNVNQQQKVLSAGAGLWQFREHGMMFLSAAPKAGQSLDEAKAVVMEQINLLKRGEFDEKLLSAIVVNEKLDYLKSIKDNTKRAESLATEYINSRGETWVNQLAMLDEMSKLTKKDIVDFANRFFADDNFAVIYKRKGEDKSIVKVEKPPITPVETNAGKTSPFVREMKDEKLSTISPVWVNYNQQIKKSSAGIAEVYYVPNEEDKLFNLTYRIGQGKWNDKKLSIAADYLEYIGTTKMSREQLNKRLYELGCQYYIAVRDRETVISISGLQENFTEAVKLVEDLLTNPKADEQALTGYKAILMKSRADLKLNKNAIAAAMQNYALYGATNPYNHVLLDEGIKSLSAEELTNIISQLGKMEHAIAYYGPMKESDFKSDILKSHPLPASWLGKGTAVAFTKKPVNENSVLFSNYDAVQAEVFWARNVGDFNIDEEATATLFNEYFGAGMGSVVFSTIRESKALAYSTYARVLVPSWKNDQFSFIGYVGAQADKVHDAIGGMTELLNTLPETGEKFANAKQRIIKSVATDRINNDELLTRYFSLKEKGIDYDLRERQYKQYQQLDFKDIENFHQQKLAGKSYTYCVIASDQRVQTANLEKYGKVRTVTLKELFGY